MLSCMIGMLVFTVKGQTNWPEKGKRIRMIITHGVGGSVDLPVRAMAPYLEKTIGIPVITENLEGNGGRRAMEEAFTAKPDGYTIVVSAFPSRLIGELLYPESKYKMKDFAHLAAWLGGDYGTVLVSAKSPYKSFAYLKEKVGMNADFIPFLSNPSVPKTS